MNQFLTELITTFPEEGAMKKHKVAYDLLSKANPKKCVETFMEAVGPYSDRISAKDDTLIHADIPMLTELNISKYWTTDLSQNTKDAIWQYLQTLQMLGMTITAIPEDTMKGIEALAQKCAGDMSDTGKLDEKALMSGVTGLLSSMGSDFDLTAMLGGLGNKNM
jgi:hypothetical protein